MLVSKGIFVDEYIELSSDYVKKCGVLKWLRCIEFYDEKKKRTFEFLSNNFYLVVLIIVVIYKDWWKVELFFKVIK